MSSQTPPARRRGRPSGRRAGESSTRDDISVAAESQFATMGFDRTSIRSIATRAGVDPALVLHYFGSKQALFLEVAAPPIPPEKVAAAIKEGPLSGAGARLARVVVGLLDEPAVRDKLVGLVRAATSEPEAARLVNELITTGAFRHVVQALGVDDAPLRASLLGSQFIGLVIARHIVRIEPLASLPSDDLAVAIAPNLQRYLTGDLT